MSNSRNSIINIENINTNIVLSFTGRNRGNSESPNQENAFLPERNSTDSSSGRQQDKIIPTLSLKITPDPANGSNSEVKIEKAILPFDTGLYFNFNDPAFFNVGWWQNCPQFVDITPNVRFVPFSGETQDIPSLEIQGRTINLKLKKDSLCIRREFDGMDFTLNLNPEMPAGTLRTSSRKHNWSLKYIPPTRIVKLPLNNADIIVRYRKSCFSSLWWLVNHHKTRGDEAYLILHKL